MAKRTEVRMMVRGMGLGIKLLELILKEIRDQGGREEILAFLTRPRFEENLRSIVRTMLACDWRIPASEIRFLAEKAYRDQFNVEEEHLEEAKNLWWYSPLSDLGIPYDTYSSDPGNGDLPIPPHIMDELNGKEMEYPLRLMNGKYVVVNWATNNKSYRPGEAIDSKSVMLVGLVEARYFNFDK